MRAPAPVAALVLCLSTLSYAAPCTELPVLFIVQDKSGSMAFTADPVNAPSAPSKWETAKATVPQVVSQFANRFRFGLMMYPGSSAQFACTTGYTVSNVGATVSQIQSAYNSVGSGGGTPTAVTLQAARSYLAGVSTTAPKYVLLITDGLPNCNLGLNDATCRTTTAGCLNTSTCSGSSCCGLGPKDCLDDNASVAAATALRNLGVKTYVVGFGTSVTSANDKAVLDAVASAGGTGQAYVANNSAALSTALNQIAASAATCCVDACANGAAMCTANGQRQTCQMDAATGCTTWNLTTCPTMSSCVNGSCQTCTNACTAGAQRCMNGRADVCVTGSNGCTSWQTSEQCNYGEICGGNQCVSCQQCAIGASRCTATGVEECDWNVISGCTEWKAKTCQSGSVCQGGQCTLCNQTCTAGAKRCTGNTPQTCVADASGCTSWQSGTVCTDFCSGGACGTCGTSCAVGSSRCNGNGSESCITDANGCPTWSNTTACIPGAEFCSGGTCSACATTCTPGTRRCGASAVEECKTDNATGCSSWAAIGACQPGDTCMNGTCIPPCQNQCTLGAGQCVGGAPSLCETAPTGCTVWSQKPACSGSDVCVEGACLGPCNADELSSCPQAGFICTGLPDGARVCLPEDGGMSMEPDAGTGGTGGGNGSSGGGAGGDGSGTGGGTAPVTKPGTTVSAGGEDPTQMAAIGQCGCGAAGGWSGIPLLLICLALLRRRA